MARARAAAARLQVRLRTHTQRRRRRRDARRQRHAHRRVGRVRRRITLRRIRIARAIADHINVALSPQQHRQQPLHVPPVRGTQPAGISRRRVHVPHLLFKLTLPLHAQLVERDAARRRRGRTRSTLRHVSRLSIATLASRPEKGAVVTDPVGPVEVRMTRPRRHISAHASTHYAATERASPSGAATKPATTVTSSFLPPT